MHDSSKCPICRGEPGGGSMSDEKFFAFLVHCRDELAGKQSRFQQRIRGAAVWAYEMADCSLTIGDEQFSMTPVGTHSQEHQTWLWAWANESFPPVAREASRRLQSLYATTGFRVFLDPGVAASSTDADDFTAMAVHQLGAIGLFRSASNDATLYLAVHERRGEGDKSIADASH
jgi:hypothetical protein